jgi:phosphoglycerate dehydrogenase-like enzyme
MKCNIVIPDPIEMPETYKEKLHDLGAHIYEDIPEDEASLIERIKDAEIITANYVDITPPVIDGAPNLKYIIVPAVGYEWVDVAQAASKGIKVLNCPTYNSEAVAEHAVALLLSVSRKINLATASLRQGTWEQKPFIGIELRDKKLALIGYGNIGKRIEKFVAGFGMQIEMANSTSSQADIDKLMRESDIVCVCTPLNSNTRHMLDERRLGLLKGSAILVNVGRGAVVDQAALVKLLKADGIRGAALDVFEGESLTGKPSDEIVALANLPNVVATPHIAYNTIETAGRLGQEVYEAIQSCLHGSPTNVISPPR